MPRDREHPNKQVIRHAGYQLLYERGVAKTSYTAIAERSGLGRPLVQHYYPKKQGLVADLINDTLNLIDAIVEELDPGQLDPFVSVLHTSQLYYEFLLFDRHMRALTRDMLAIRFVSNNIISQHARRVLEMLDDFDRDRVEQISVQVGDGANGMIFYQLVKGQPIDTRRLSLYVSAAFWGGVSGNIPFNDAMTHLRGHLWPEERVHILVAGLVTTLFS